MASGRSDDRAPAVVAVSTAFESDWLTVREAVLRDGDALSRWYYTDHPGCALVLPVTTDGRVALIRVWRIAPQQWCLEAPAGRIESGEEPAQAARRELREEIGGYDGDLHFLGSVFSSSGSSNEQVHVFAARGVRLGRSNPDPGEQIERMMLSAGQALELARKGQVEDAPTALAIFWAHDRGLLGPVAGDAGQ